jgi:APA family basic amino acid/polyamine antiporter
VITTILVIGIKESATFNTFIVIIKVSVVLFVLALGARFVIPATGAGLAYVCALRVCGHRRGAAYIFFAYIGFDAVSTTAQEAKNPQRDLPIGIIVRCCLHRFSTSASPRCSPAWFPGSR